MQYNKLSIDVGKLIAVIMFLMEFSWKKTRKILNHRTEKEHKLLSISDQTIENRSAVSSFM